LGREEAKRQKGTVANVDRVANETKTGGGIHWQ
jgi:hypothetical protein